MVVIPYIEGVSEKLQCIFWKQKISTAMRPHNTIKNLLVHPKDKREANQMCEVVYDISCKGCDKSYIGETGRAFGTRLKEHQSDAEKVANRKFTRAQRKESTSELNKSAITDHIAQENHVIDWDGAKILDRDSNQFTRKIREAICICRRGSKTMNRDVGSITLDHVYDSLLKHRTLGRRLLSNFAGKAAIRVSCDQVIIPWWRKLNNVSLFLDLFNINSPVKYNNHNMKTSHSNIQLVCHTPVDFALVYRRYIL